MAASFSQKQASFIGLGLALLIFGLWGATLWALLSWPISGSLHDFWWVVPGFLAQTFLYTGLFILAHDALHQSLTPAWPRLGRALGWLAAALYAGFSLKRLGRAHMQHHRHPAQIGRDPDFHDGQRSGFWPWYGRFVCGYLSLWQIAVMTIVFNVLHHLGGIGAARLWLFWAAPALASTVQLFYVGTYLPHRGPHDQADAHRAQSLRWPSWLSFVACYHFGYHQEHHLHSKVAWWQLPALRRRLDP